MIVALDGANSKNKVPPPTKGSYYLLNLSGKIPSICGNNWRFPPTHFVKGFILYFHSINAFFIYATLYCTIILLTLFQSLSERILTVTERNDGGIYGGNLFSRNIKKNLGGNQEMFDT